MFALPLQCSIPLRHIGNALIRRRLRDNVPDENHMRLGLRIEGFFERRLQARMSKSRLAMWIRRAHVLIRQKHSHVGKQIVNVTSFGACLDFQRHNAGEFTSPYDATRDLLPASVLLLSPTRKLSEMRTRCRCGVLFMVDLPCTSF
ncbi:putative 40S ribosomal protein S9 [Rhizoctonia solani 123E]|uniref:Putative 40S ribosomal protein S9 n=1 Tax=Rhizoctonia solani 123E TaxID=1423351 RepID=A0A074RCU5_9AGAM|nr:putative 40S ribosomal protein S9 [Rhizoctonia solani 123E]